jgi:hypothetical protein
MTFILPPRQPTEQELSHLPPEPWSLRTALRTALPWTAFRIGCLPSCCAAIVGTLVGSSLGYNFGHRIYSPKPFDPGMLPDQSWPLYTVLGMWGALLGGFAGAVGAMCIAVYVYSRVTQVKRSTPVPENRNAEPGAPADRPRDERFRAP